ncbi:hypothetical protein MMC17_007036 [Xylographa soralifera]|nr:hypothetical protein [Xylographa soralifera]
MWNARRPIWDSKPNTSIVRRARISERCKIIADKHQEKSNVAYKVCCCTVIELMDGALFLRMGAATQSAPRCAHWSTTGFESLRDDHLRRWPTSAGSSISGAWSAGGVGGDRGVHLVKIRTVIVVQEVLLNPPLNTTNDNRKDRMSAERSTTAAPQAHGSTTSLHTLRDRRVEAQYKNRNRTLQSDTRQSDGMSRLRQGSRPVWEPLPLPGSCLHWLELRVGFTPIQDLKVPRLMRRPTLAGGASLEAFMTM